MSDTHVTSLWDEDAEPQVADEVLDSPSEIAINATVDATPVISGVVDMSPAVLWAFCNDVAQNIYGYNVLAIRYGFGSEEALHEFLISNAAVRRKAKEIRAVWQSDDNVGTRARTLAGHALLEAIPSTAKIMMNEKVPDNTRMEAFTKHARVAGVDGLPPAARNGNTGINDGSGVGRFSVNIVFAGAGKVETFATIDHVNEKTKEELWKERHPEE